MITCNENTYCEFKFQEGSRVGCKYTGYCDFQRPNDSRLQIITCKQCKVNNEEDEALRTKFIKKLIEDAIIQHNANYHDGLNESHPHFGNVR